MKNLLILFLNLGLSELIIILLIIGLMIIPRIFYLVTLQKTLEAIKVENRQMNPGQVWLELIPLFGLVWQFFNVINVSNSLKGEFQSRGIKPQEDRPAYSIGIAFCVLTCCSIIPFLGILTGIASLICWIIFWVKITNYKSQLL